MKSFFWPFFLVGIFSLLLLGCDTSEVYAPVTEISSFESLPKSGGHRVLPRETLYEIAWRYGLDYRYLAVRNNISPPYVIHTGEIIYLQESKTLKKESYFQKPKIKPKLIQAIKEDEEPITLPTSGKVAWLRPAGGKIIRFYSPLNKGIDISGKEGESIYATAAGKVVYCGDGLRGYGNLIILKHNSLFLSAYAHNRSLLVKEGELVKQGQKIAEMGNTGTDKSMLHFEIRRAGKPIDPLSLLRSMSEKS